MRNIIRIMLSDWKRLSTNVVAVVVIIGLSVIPCLYAWFNILSNWAPYDEEATGRLSVAVASEDDGMKIGSIELNVGDTILENLEANKSINWVFCDTSYEAIRGVESGDYYAALVIDRDFSKNIVSFLGGNMEHPTIAYYENEKKNAIAPKITGKVKTAIQKTVNSTFISTIAETIAEAGKYFLEADDENNITGGVLGRLHRLDSDLSLSISMIDSYIALLDSTENLMTAAGTMTDEVDTMFDNAESVAAGARASADAAESSVSAMTDVVEVNIANQKQELQRLGTSIRSVVSEMKESGTVQIGRVEGLQTAATALQTGFDYATADLVGVDEQKAAVNADITQLYNDLGALKGAANLTIDQTNELIIRLDTDINNTSNSLQNLADTYRGTVRPQLSGTMDTVEGSLTEVMTLFNFTGDSVQEVAAALGSYPDMLSLGRESLTNGRNEISSMQEKLRDLIEMIETLDENEQYTMVIKLLRTDPEIIADFVSEPITIDQQSIYPIENNGSAMSPFYIVLSIWVGALIMVAIIHAKVSAPIETVSDMKTYQEFFGRYATFFVIGQIQTLITVLGALFYVGIQCQHIFLFWLAASFTSFAFTIFLYSLAYAFEAVGEALAVILMVIQVAGSGGSFPIEVLPEPFQIMYQYMPFMHAMNALRECIAGMYGNDYWIYLSGLLPYVGIAIVIGVVLSKPCRGLLKKIEESKERTELLI